MSTHGALDRLFDQARAVDRGEEPGPAEETARHMSDLLLKMRNLAHRSRMGFLTYLLEMAYYEAFSIANKVDLTADDLELLKQFKRQAEAAPKPDEPAQKVA